MAYQDLDKFGLGLSKIYKIVTSFNKIQFLKLFFASSCKSGRHSVVAKGPHLSHYSEISYNYRYNIEIPVNCLKTSFQQLLHSISYP